MLDCESTRQEHGGGTAPAASKTMVPDSNALFERLLQRVFSKARDT